MGSMTQAPASLFDSKLTAASCCVAHKSASAAARKARRAPPRGIAAATPRRCAVMGSVARGMGGFEAHGRARADAGLAVVRCTAGDGEGDHQGSRREEEELADGIMEIVRLLPETVRPALESRRDLPQLVEVVMDLGRVPLARFPDSGDVPLSEDIVTTDDLEFAIQEVGDFGGDNRAGIEGTLHRISCIRNRDGKIVGLTCRVGRNVGNSAELASDLVLSGKSILFMGRPGVGKTTVIRGICQMLANVCEKRVVIVDTSNEIGGDGDVAHPGIGRARRMQVPAPEEQHHVMIEAVENHMPEVIVIDEIGTEMECQAARTISQRGVQLVATAHGCELENVIKNPSLQELVGGITSVTLGDDEAKRRRVQKTVLEREGPPAFDVAIEILDKDTWRIHHDLAAAVDASLAGGTDQGEIRSKQVDGEITSKQGLRPAPPTLPLYPETASSAVPGPPGLRRARLGEEEEEEDPAASAGKGRSQARGKAPSAAKQSVEREQDGDSGFGWDLIGDSVEETQSVGISREDNEAEGVAREWFEMGGQREGKGVVLTLYLLGVDVRLLWEVVGAMELTDKVAVTPYLKNADAILGTKTKLKITGWVRQASRVSGIPLFPLKTCSASQLVKGLHSLMGLYPSNPSPEIQESEREGGHTSTNANAAPATLSHDEEEALAEVQIAIEEIVLPRGQPIELLPRLPTVIKMQINFVRGYDLGCETVGSGNNMRIRILPSKVNSKNDDTLRDKALA